jgi:hypothetical protein
MTCAPEIKPDARLTRFISENLPTVLPGARERFNTFKDLLEGYVAGEHTYPSLAARVRRRLQGTNEDRDTEDADEQPEPDEEPEGP